MTESYQVFYTKIYETTRANETFRKLKSILIIASDVFLKYISLYELSPLISDMKGHFTDKNQAILIKRLGATLSYFSTINQNGNSLEQQTTQSSTHANSTFMNYASTAVASSTSTTTAKYTELKMSYLDLLIIVCLRYI